MWEMRPRFATSAGELKRRRKHEVLEKKLERERREVRRRGTLFLPPVSFPYHGAPQKSDERKV